MLMNILLIWFHLLSRATEVSQSGKEEEKGRRQRTLAMDFFPGVIHLKQELSYKINKYKI